MASAFEEFAVQRVVDKATGLGVEVPAAVSNVLHAEADDPARVGHPAEKYFAVWLDSYDIAVSPTGEVLGVGWSSRVPRRIKPLRAHREALEPEFSRG